MWARNSRIFKTNLPNSWESHSFIDPKGTAISRNKFAKIWPACIQQRKQVRNRAYASESDWELIYENNTDKQCEIAENISKGLKQGRTKITNHEAGYPQELADSKAKDTAEQC